MNYGLTIYGPLDKSDGLSVTARIMYVFSVQIAQAETAWETMKNFPDFNYVEITKRRSTGDLVIHVYYFVGENHSAVECAFHAKISPSGTYA